MDNQMKSAMNKAASSAENNVEETVKKEAKKVVFGIVGAAAILVIVICVALNMSRTINLDKYVTIKVTGYEGYGTISAKIDWDAIEEKYGDEITFKSKAKTEYGEFLDLMTPIDVLKDGIKVEFSEKNHLKNGDKVKYTWNIDAEITEYIDCKFKSKGGTYEVSALEEVVESSSDIESNSDVESNSDEYDVEVGDGFEQYAEHELSETDIAKTEENRSDSTGTETTNSENCKSSFYGIWCYGTKELAEAQEYLEKMEEDIHGSLFVSSDWTNLNKEKWYVVAAGIYETEEEAEHDLPRIQNIYPDAYIKYSGEYVGSQRIQYTVISLDNIVEGPDYFDITPVTTNMTLRIDKNTEFDSTCDMIYFENYQKGDTVLEWYQKNYELGKSGKSTQALIGVFEVSLTDNHVDKIYGIYWWD